MSDERHLTTDKLNALRTIAIIMVLMQHAFTHTVCPNNLLSKLTYNSNTILFLFISGYLFEMNLDKYKNMKISKFVCKKFIRLMVPYFSWNFILWGVVFFLHTFSKSSLYLDSVGFEKISFYKAIEYSLKCQFPYVEHFWYLYIVFFIFVFSIAIKKSKISIYKYFFLLTLFSILSTYIELSEWLLRFLWSYPIFYVGRLYFRNMTVMIKVKINIIFVFVVWMLLFIDFHYTVIFTGVLRKIEDYIFLYLSIELWVFISNKFIKFVMFNNFCKYLSKKSYGIYLMHNPYFVICSSVFLTSIGLHWSITIFISIAIGIVGPIIIDNAVIQKSRLLKLFLLGEV